MNWSNGSSLDRIRTSRSDQRIGTSGSISFIHDRSAARTAGAACRSVGSGPGSVLDSPPSWPRSRAAWCSCCVSRSPFGSSAWPPSCFLLLLLVLLFQLLGIVYRPRALRSAHSSSGTSSGLSTCSKSCSSTHNRKATPTCFALTASSC